MEQWRKMIYQGVESKDYSVSTLGNIRNDKTNRLLKPQSTGYLHVRIPHNGNMKNIRLHRAIAETFLTRLPEHSIVNHINNNKNDNRVANLEWCTQSFNVSHSLKLRESEAVG